MNKIKKEVVEKLAALITAAFGLVAALAWNDTVKAIFRKFSDNGDNVFGMIIYAVLITLVAVIATVYVGRVSSKVK